MKGLGLHQDNPTTYLSVKYNMICQISKRERDGFSAIKIPDMSTGEELTKFVKRYDFVEGMITAIEWRDTKQEYVTRFQSWRIHMDAAGVPVILEIPLKSAAGDRFMKLAENLNFTRPVEFRAWLDTKDGKDKTAFWVLQDGQTVLQKYKKGEMGNCPEAVEELDGWNYSAQLKYLHDQIMNVVIPRLEAARAMQQTTRSNGDRVSEPVEGDWDDQF